MTKALHTLLIITALLAMPVAVLAHNEVHIQNSSSASANTGGNTAEGGQVIEGEAHSEARVETTINGKTYEVHDSGTSSASAEQNITVDNDVVESYSAANATGSESSALTDNSAGGAEGVATNTAEIEVETDVSISGERGVFAWARTFFGNIFTYVGGIF